MAKGQAQAKHNLKLHSARPGLSDLELVGAPAEAVLIAVGTRPHSDALKSS